MKKELNIDSWARKDHFNFFMKFEEPFFGVTIDIDCTIAYEISKAINASFFIYYLHKSLVAANKIESFRYSISDNKVFIYDQVNASPTINRPDGSFGFAYMDYHESFEDFRIAAQKEKDRVQNSLGLVPSISGQNVIHYSSMPWINFKSVSHARSFSFKDSCPKISFGKMTTQQNKKIMPVSIHVHHALMDGYQVSQFIDLFQQLMNE